MVLDEPLASSQSLRTVASRVLARTAPITGKILPWATRSRVTKIWSNRAPEAFCISASQPFCSAVGSLGMLAPSLLAASTVS